MTNFHPLRVRALERIAREAVAITFDLPAALAEQFDFAAGQYLTLRAEIGGEEVRRSYSLCCQPGHPPQVAVKKVPGGRFSTYANDQLKVGDIIDVMRPAGRFVCAPAKEAGVRHVAFAAGSGITPIASILNHALETRPSDTFTLFYGNKSQASTMFIEALHRTKDRHLQRFSLYHVLSREAVDVPLFRGRLDREKVQQLAEAKLFEPRRTDVAYICGPGAMIEEVRAELESLGVPEERIRSERFSAAPKSEGPIVVHNPRPIAPSISVEVLLDGTRRPFQVEIGEGLLDAGARQGIELPYSCAGGMCSTCRCRVLEGEAEMKVNYSLEPWELERGFILACQAIPRSQKLVLDFDGQ